MKIITPKISTSQPIPYFESFVHAGFPSPAEGYSNKKLDLNEYIIKHPHSTFFVKVEGDSMKGSGIYSGDIVVVDRILDAKHNHIVLAVIDGEFTLKRLSITQLKNGQQQITLFPENSNYQPINIVESMDFQIWGVVTFTIHQSF